MASLRADAAILTDQQVVDALRTGDDAAFTLLLERYHASLVQLALSFVGDPAIATSVVRDAVRDMLGALPSFDGQSSFGAWLFGFVIRRARPRSPSSASQADTEHGPAVDPTRFRGPDDPYHGGWRSFPPSWGAAPDERIRSPESQARVRGALDALPPAQQQVVLLHDVHACSAAEVSALLGISEATQRMLMHHGRTSLRQVLASFLSGE